MKNLIAELLIKLAQKEEEAKELVVQVEALEIVVTALLRNMDKAQRQALISGIDAALQAVSPQVTVPEKDSELLQGYLQKLLVHPRS